MGSKNFPTQGRRSLPWLGKCLAVGKNFLGTEGKNLSSRETFPYYLLMRQFSIYDKVTRGFNFEETLPYIFRNEKPFPNGIFGNKKKQAGAELGQAQSLFATS